MRAPRSLIEAACSGNRLAVEQLLAVCQPDLKRFARQTCSTSEDAEDAVQVALWQMHRKLGALKMVEAFATWLFRIVERECYRLFRRRAPGNVEIADGDLPELAAPAIPVDLRIDLTAAIAALPPPYRVVLILRDIDELTAPETASQLGISTEAVKSRLHRARAMVRERMAKSGYRDADMRGADMYEDTTR
jgi:RNA polymerase sigma factor (sigma-70 family)